MPSACVSHTKKVDAIDYWPKYNILGAQHINKNFNSNISVTHEYPYTISAMPQLYLPALPHESIHYAQDHN